MPHIPINLVSYPTPLSHVLIDILKNRNAREIVKKMKNKRKASGGPKGSMFKKRKRSKKFWAQRKTAEMAPAPQGDEENETETDSEASDPEPDNYDALVNAFAKPSAEAFSSNESSDTDEEKEDKKQVDSGDSEDPDDDDDLNEVESGSDDNDDSDHSDDETSEKEASDSFFARIEAEFPQDLKLKIDAKEYRKETMTWSNMGKILVQTADYEVKTHKRSSKLLDKTESQSEEMEYEQLKQQEKLVKLSLTQPPKKSTNQIKPQLKDNLAWANVKHLDNLLKDSLNPLQDELFAAMSTYKDLYFCQETLNNLEEIRLVYVLHALNHMLKTRRKILKNNEKLNKDKNVEKTCRDQGLCRPKVLIIVPFKGKFEKCYLGSACQKKTPKAHQEKAEEFSVKSHDLHDH